MDDDSDSDYVVIVEQPSPTVVNVLDDEDPVANNDNFRTYATQGSVRAPVSESSCGKSNTDSATIHDVFHSRMEQFLSSSKSHQSVPGIVVSGRVVKRKVVSYLILDSDSDFSDVEICDGSSDTNKEAKISESAPQPATASNLIRKLASNVTPGPASVAREPQESSKKSLYTKRSTVEETVASGKEIVRYPAGHSAGGGLQNDGHCSRMGNDEETALSSNSAKEPGDEHGLLEQSGESLDLEFDVEVAEDFSEHEAEEGNSCGTSSSIGGHWDHEGDVLDSEELACLASYTAGHSPNFDGVTGSSGIQPLAISISEKSNKVLQAQSFQGCRTVASKELGQSGAGQKRRSNVQTHAVSCQLPAKFSRTSFTDIQRDSTKLLAVATAQAENDTARRPSHACQEGTVQGSSRLNDPARRPSHACQEGTVQGSSRLNDTARRPSHACQEGTVQGSSRLNDTARRPSHACQEGTVQGSSPLNATSATSVLEGLLFSSALTNTGGEAQHPVRPILLVKSSHNGVVSINSVNEAVNLNPAMPQTNMSTEGVIFSPSIHVQKAESQGPQLQLSPHLLQNQTNAETDCVDGPPDTDFIIRLGVDKVQSPASELTDNGASENRAADHAWHLGISPGSGQEEDAFDQTDQVAVDTVVKRKPQRFDCAFHMQDELVDAESEMSETFPLDVTTLNDPEFQRCLTEPVPSKKVSSFLLRAQNAKFEVCHHCGEDVLNKPCLLWGKKKVMTTNVNGVLMVTIAELARMGFIDYHIAKHKLLNKKEFPAVWSYVMSDAGKSVLGVSLVFVVFVVKDTLTLHQYLPKRRRTLMKKGLKTPFKLVGMPNLPLHLEEPQKTHLLTNSKYSCSYITCTAVRAKRVSSRTASFPLFTNSSLNRDRNECSFLCAMDGVLYNSGTRLIRKGVLPSLRLMYPPCPCQEVSKLDVKEREAWKTSGRLPISSLQVLRFMGCNVFCFNEDDIAGSYMLHVSVAELQHRELLPAQLGIDFFRASNPLHGTGDIRTLKEEERVFLTQYFDMTCDKSTERGYTLWYACTPFALQQLYRELSKTHYKYDRHSKALFYVMTLGHHCYWSLQVTPPTCQLHEVPGYEELIADKRPAAIILNSASEDKTKTQRLKEAYYDGGGGTAPALKRLRQTLNMALQQTIKAFQLQDIAQPFCQCQVRATSLHKYRFLTFDDVELSHVTHMVFDGQLLHCWKRNYGFFVSWAELEAKDLLPRKRFGSAVAQFPNQPWCSFMLASELKFLSCLPLEAQNGKNSHTLINIKFLRLWYGLFPESEWPWCLLAEQTFYVKLWKHSCPAKTESLEDAVQVVDLTGDEQKAGITSSGSLSEGNVASLKAGITPSGSLSEGDVASLKAGITSSGSLSEDNVTQSKAREFNVRISDPELLRLVPSVPPTSQPLRGSNCTSIRGLQSTVERENEAHFHLTGSATGDQETNELHTSSSEPLKDSNTAHCAWSPTSRNIVQTTVKTENERQLWTTGAFSDQETTNGSHISTSDVNDKVTQQQAAKEENQEESVCLENCSSSRQSQEQSEADHSQEIQPATVKSEEAETEGGEHLPLDSSRAVCECGGHQLEVEGFVKEEPAADQNMHCNGDSERTQDSEDADHPAKRESVEQSDCEGMSVNSNPAAQGDDSANQPARHLSVQPSTQPSFQPSFQQATSVGQHPTTRDGDIVNQQAWHLSVQPSVQPSSQPSFQPSFQQATSVGQHPTTRDGDIVNQQAWHLSVQPSVQPSFQPSFQQATSVGQHPTTRGSEAVCTSYSNTCVVSNDLQLLPACPCPARPTGPFPTFSFLQGMCTGHSVFTILKDVGQAVIHNRLVYYFKVGNAVFFSLDYLKHSKVLNFSPKLSVLMSAWEKGTKNESPAVKLFLRENGEEEDGVEAGDDLLIRPDQLRQMMAACGRSMNRLYLHQVGHICPETCSIAHRAQRSHPHMKHVQSAWARAFHWHQDFHKQLAAVGHGSNSTQQRTELPSTKQRKDAHLAAVGHGSNSTQQRTELPSTKQRKDAHLAAVVHGSNSAEQRKDVPSAGQWQDAPSAEQIKHTPSKQQRKDAPSIEQRPSLDNKTGEAREGMVCVRTLPQTEEGAVAGQQSMDFVSIFPIPWRDFHLGNVKQEPSTEHHGSHTADLLRDPAVRDAQENCGENEHGCPLPQGHSDCAGIKQECGEERVHASTPSHVPKHPEQTHICGNLKMSEGSAVPVIWGDEKNPGITPVAVQQDRFTEAMTPSTLEGVVLQSCCKGVQILHCEEQVRELLVDREKGAMFSGHHIVLTGILTAADCRYVCFSVGGILYVNWREVVNQVEEPSNRKVLFKQAQQLHAFLYQPPLYIVQLFSCRYGADLDLLMSAPWVALNTLVAIYNMGSGILAREKMLKRFVDITPSSLQFGMFLLLRKEAS